MKKKNFCICTKHNTIQAPGAVENADCLSV